MNLGAFRIALAGSAIGLITALPVVAFAHHSFASEFDADQPFRVEGEVNSIEWTNPHGRLHVDVQEDNEVVTYDLELPSPNALIRQGWSRTDLEPGDKVIVTGHRARNRPNVGRASGISRENGEAVFGGGVQDEED